MYSESDKADVIPKTSACHTRFSFSFLNLDCLYQNKVYRETLLDHVFFFSLSSLQNTAFLQVFSLLQVMGMIKFAISLVINSLSAFYTYV